MTKKNGNQSFSLRRFIQNIQHARVRENERAIRLSDVESGLPRGDTFEKVKIEPTLPNKFDSVNGLADFSSVEEKLCMICLTTETETNKFFVLESCGHKFCVSCLIMYLQVEINESRTDLDCPQCSIGIHPNNIEILLRDFPEFKNKYEDFMIRRYLVLDPDARWCPAPDCSYAVIASGCASCPELKCERPSCGASFCYHCKSEWHPDQTCDAARIARQSVMRTVVNFSSDTIRRDEIKPCPRCQVLIVKMNDGSCNHMVCSVCGAEFCWLCMKEVSDLHYLSPSGCTFWGKKPWSRKKKIVWQIGTLIGAPVGIALLAGIAVPSMVIGIPVWVGRKLYERYKTTTRHKRNFSVTIGVVASILISPLIAGLAIAIGVPILLFYVYGIVPVSLCRAGCGASSYEDYNFNSNTADETHNQYHSSNGDTNSRIGETSIGEVSATSGSVTGVPSKNINCNTVLHHESTEALAGSVNNHELDIIDSSSTEHVESILNMAKTYNVSETSLSMETSLNMGY